MEEERTVQIRKIREKLPGLNCSLCGFRTCDEFAEDVLDHPGDIKKCVNLSANNPFALQAAQKTETVSSASVAADACGTCPVAAPLGQDEARAWKDFLGREYDFVLQIFPGEVGPRETILPHNPSLTKELEIKKGDVLIGRPLGMSCGCPITHCGVVMEVDYKTGVMVWCVTGPLRPRMSGFKDIGYYAAEAYEGIIKDAKKELRVGLRYWFLPSRCMLQWRHSGLINFLNKINDGYQVRIEGLMIG